MSSSSFIVQAAQPVLLTETGYIMSSPQQLVFANDYVIPYSTALIIKIVPKSTTAVQMKYQAAGSNTPITAFINNGFPLFALSWAEFTFGVSKNDRINFNTVAATDVMILVFANAPEGIGGSI
ncbi:MAG: hypothetical protein QXL94_00025 [Candidatus Parvarchaeum sp.]